MNPQCPENNRSQNERGQEGESSLAVKMEMVQMTWHGFFSWDVAKEHLDDFEPT